jgi:hypothetical protein
MEKSYYSLRINTKESNYNLVSEILSVKPNDLSRGWIYEIKKEENIYFDFIESFLKLLENNFGKLADIGIHKENISIWLIYEYNNQCNLEFSPDVLKRLGDNEISLCISCYEAGYN